MKEKIKKEKKKIFFSLIKKIIKIYENESWGVNGGVIGNFKRK